MNKPRGKPFQTGNPGGPGRPKGRKNNATLEAQQLLADYAPALIRKCISEALRGNMTALRLGIERILAVPRDTLVSFPCRRIETAADFEEAQQQVRRLVSRGQLAPIQGEEISRSLDRLRAAIEGVEFDERLNKLEQKQESEP